MTLSTRPPTMKRFYILNWKMYLSHHEGLEWLNHYKKQLESLGQKASLIVCPPSTLVAVAEHIIPKTVFLGAQDCSAYTNGAFTGDCSAQSLKEAGARFCIVGHSERRKNYCETPTMVAEKTAQLIKIGLTPIVCFGSSIRKELPPLIKHIEKLKPSTILIAYEPESAIGSDQLPPDYEIEEMGAFIKKETVSSLPATKTYILYGGSVNPSSIKTLLNIPFLDGFLLGRSSTDFQVLEKIVGLT